MRPSLLLPPEDSHADRPGRFHNCIYNMVRKVFGKKEKMFPSRILAEAQVRHPLEKKFVREVNVHGFHLRPR